MKVLFVGERRSETAKRRGWRWEDGHLAAKQLFDAFDAVGFDRTDASFCNFSDRGAKELILRHDSCDGPIVAMGMKAWNKLAEWNLRGSFGYLVHPAARGKVRSKAEYALKVREVLLAIGLKQRWTTL